jgi:glyoxylase I family protein
MAEVTGIDHIYITVSDLARYEPYAPGCATFFTDPDCIRLEVTNYRQERRERHDHWA